MISTVYTMELLQDATRSIADLDFMILSSGSDSRAYQVLSSANLTRRNSPKVLMLHFTERLAGRKRSDFLFRYATLRIKHLQEINCAIKDPSSSLKELENNDFGPTKKIGIDISCLTKPYFYFLIKLFKERFGLLRLSVYYTEPKSYLFPKGSFDTFHTSSGPLSITEIPGYSGVELRGAKRKLIILLGFDGDLSKEINEDVAPNETLVVNGFPAYAPKFKDISLIANAKLVRDEKNITVKYARANNPFEVYNLLETIKDKSERNTFINVAPLGTKPMALGACLFALHNADVRVIYPLPDKYEDKYSNSFWNSWVYDLPLEL